MGVEKFDHQNLEALGRQLRSRRKLRKWSLKQLATASGVSVTAIRNIELGHSNPSLVTIMSLIDCLGASIDQLIAEARSSGVQIKVTRAEDGQSATQNVTGDLAKAEMSGTICSVSRDAKSPLALGDRAVFGYVLAGAVHVSDGTGTTQCAAGDAFHFASGINGHLKPSAGANASHDEASPRVFLVNGPASADLKSSKSGIQHD